MVETWRPFADDELEGAAASFDDAALEFARWWSRENGHELFRRIADFSTLTPGRGIALVVEGTPLVDGDTPGEWWRFASWQQGAPVPHDESGKLTLDGRIRWVGAEERPAVGPWKQKADAPDDEWVKLIRAYLDVHPRRVVLIGETYNADGESHRPGPIAGIVTYRNQAGRDDVIHLLTSDATDEQIEAASDAAHGFGGGEWTSCLVALPDDLSLSYGDRLTDEIIERLVAHVDGLCLKAFDGEGFVMWAIGEPTLSWIGPGRILRPGTKPPI